MGNKLESLADNRFESGQYHEAKETYEKVLNKIKEGSNPKKRARILNKIGDCYAEMKNFYDSILTYEKALNIQQDKLGLEDISIASTYTCLGIVFFKNKKWEESLLYFEKALNIQVQKLKKGAMALAVTYYNIGQVLTEMGKGEKALEHYLKALEINKKNKGSLNPIVATNHYAIGILYLQFDDLENAESHLRYALNIRKKYAIQDNLEIAKILAAQGVIASTKKNYELAMKLHREAVSLRQSVLSADNPLLITSKHSLAKVLFRASQYTACKALIDELILFYEKDEESYSSELQDIYGLLGNLYKEIENQIDSELAYAKSLLYEKTKAKNESSKVSDNLNFDPNLMKLINLQTEISEY